MATKQAHRGHKNKAKTKLNTKAKAEKKTVKKVIVKRGKSEIVPPKSQTETVGLKAFRMTQDIKDFLLELPRGKDSAFIVEAIREKMEKRKRECPMCQGLIKLNGAKIIKKVR